MSASGPPDFDGAGAVPDPGPVLPPPPAPKGRIVRRSLRLARTHLSDGLLAGLLILAPTSFLTAFLTRETLDFEIVVGTGAAASDGGSSWVGLLEAFILSPWAFAAVFLLLAARVSGFGEAVPAGLRRLPHVLGASVLTGVVSLLPMVPAVIAFLAGGGVAFLEDLAADGETALLGGLPDGVVAATVLFVLALPVGLFLGLSLGLTLPLVVADRMGPLRALKVSWVRMSGQRLRLLGGTLGLLFPAMFVLMFSAFVLTLPAVAIGPEGGWVITGAVNAVFGVAVALLLAAVYAVIHADTAPAEPAADAGVVEPTEF